MRGAFLSLFFGSTMPPPLLTSLRSATSMLPSTSMLPPTSLASPSTSPTSPLAMLVDVPLVFYFYLYCLVRLFCKDVGYFEDSVVYNKKSATNKLPILCVKSFISLYTIVFTIHYSYTFYTMRIQFHSHIGSGIRGRS